MEFSHLSSFVNFFPSTSLLMILNAGIQAEGERGKASNHWAEIVSCRIHLSCTVDLLPLPFQLSFRKHTGNGSVEDRDEESTCRQVELADSTQPDLKSGYVRGTHGEQGR